MSVKIVFMGTPDFAAEALRALLAAGHEIKMVVTQPDKPRGRSGTLVPSPVKVCALEHSLPLFQPVRIKRPEAVEEIRAVPADVFVVAAFGQILSQEILDIPPLGCLNIHASLLPKYRGASPIQQVILKGEKETGITVMQMDAGVDTGDMLYKKKIPILEQDTFETLHNKLMVLGGEAIVEALALLEQGKLVPEKQREEESSHASLIGKSLGKIDFGQDAVVIDRLIRGLNPWPSAYTTYQGRQLKIWRAVPVPGGQEDICTGHNARRPGQILEVDRETVTVATGQGGLRIYELQLEGKKRMSTHDFLLGVKMVPGEMLGT